MKNIIMFLLVFPMIFSGITYSQISQPVRLTNGNDDRNPSFGEINNLQGFGYLDFEFLIFERHTDNYSQICVSKINFQGSVDSAYYLTNGPYSNINPAIEYNSPGYPDRNIHTAFAVWQSNRFGRESIFGASYSNLSGWSEPFIIDSSNANNGNPVLKGIDSANYFIVYESNDDIKFKKFNLVTHEVSAEGNLTAQVPEICYNPKVLGNSSSVFITYSKEYSQIHKAIFYRNGPPDSFPLVENPGDTIAFTGINRSLGFGNRKLQSYHIFETNRNGNTDIYAVRLAPWYDFTSVIVDSAYDNLDYKGTDIDITDNITNYIYSYFRRSASDLGLMFKYLSWSTSNIKISNDPFFSSKITMGNGAIIPVIPCEEIWFVFNKDSLDPGYPSTIYGVSFRYCVTDIIQTSNSQPENFYLHQNYPNPFNPETNLEFGISELGFVSLKIYDALGNEVATLVNEIKPAGRYSVEWNAGEFPSGIYFYKLTSGNFSEVKKMTLLK